MRVPKSYINLQNVFVIITYCAVQFAVCETFFVIPTTVAFVSFMEIPKVDIIKLNTVSDNLNMKGWKCHCWNSSNGFEDEVECRCEGESLVRIPQKLHPGMQRLTIASAGLPLLRTTGLKIYASSLQDLTLTDLDNFESIQPAAFDSIQNLRTIYISHAPKLAYLSKEVFAGIPKTIKTIRIIYSGLVKIPDMRYLSNGDILHMVDLEGNHIAHIRRHSVRIRTEQLILDNNELTTIEDAAFYGSEIAKLSLKSNRQLSFIYGSAFEGILNIRELDLSSTSIVNLPTKGLEGLEILRVQNTHSLKIVPSIYNFKNLQVAWLTHSFHCCAFKFPSRHDPISHAKRLKYLSNLQKACVSGSSHHSENPKLKELRRFARNIKEQKFFDHFEHENINQSSTPFKLENKQNPFVHAITGSPIVTINGEDYKSEDIYSENNDFGEFHETTADVMQNYRLDEMCGNLTQTKIMVRCFPTPDALNPCEDVMGSYWLRGSVWLVLLLAVFGNMAVLIVLMASRSDFSVPRFLMSHLAFADLCMGLYLLLLASIDAHSMGEYFNYAFDWQYGSGCKIAGFLTVFASHLSVFTLTIITIERWFAITQAIYLNKRIKLRPAMYIMIGGWIYSALMSAFPLYGISNYSSTSICLPMQVGDSWDIAYLVAILGLNGAGFFVIVICYAQIYFSLGKDTRRSARGHSAGEMTIAKKMALLVFTNFSCWAPIAFFGLTALAGYPLINITKSKILLVFFYPLNSCADPYLYAILTSQYRRDLYILLSRFGFCTQKAEKYRRSFSIPGTNQTNVLPLVQRPSLSPSCLPNEETNKMLKEDFV